MKQMTLRRIHLLGLVAMAILLQGIPSHAAPLAAISSLSNPPGGLNGSTAQSYGWRFRAEQNFNITALGFADIDGLIFGLPPSNGLANEHSVILWDSSGTNLAQATIQSGTGSAVGPGTLNLSGTATGVFRYETLASPVAVTSGSTYTISAFFPRFSQDARVFDGPPGAVGTYDGRITPLGLSFLASGSHIFPTGITGPFKSVAGPNFLIDQPVTAVPLPAAFPLLAGGFGLMVLLSWCRKRKAGATA